MLLRLDGLGTDGSMSPAASHAIARNYAPSAHLVRYQQLSGTLSCDVRVRSGCTDQVTVVVQLHTTLTMTGSILSSPHNNQTPSLDFFLEYLCLRSA